MRLKSIKLAGFKSFVDPTTIPFPHNLTAIVGPNGCGKSNVIDAVRWVMGESSARYLRGESMADVIFNGSTGRKPVGQASIELVFDNQDGTLGGEYHRYSEIAVKRQVNRDGRSDYFLNSSRCRRKDITDIFLGTGLGPRSYAIIEQGMISRLIEARPEELRSYIEEAAGISRYKERRKETETRLTNTRDNLARLNDIREELARQLAHLQKQADAAAKYRQLKGEERQTRAELLVWRGRHLQDELQTLEQQIQSHAEALAQALASQQHIEVELLTARQAEEQGHQTVLAAQNHVYGVRNAISQSEQQIRHLQQRGEQWQQQISLLDARQQQTEQDREQDQDELLHLQQELAALQPERASAEALASDSRWQLEQRELELQHGQQACDVAQQQVANGALQVQRWQDRVHTMEQGLLRAQDRQQKLHQEMGQFATDELLLDVEQQQEELAILDVGLQEQQATLESLDEQIRHLAQQRQQVNQELHQAKTQQQQTAGKISALQALQQAALRRDDRALNQWLQAQGWSQQARLAEVLTVTTGFEPLVEAVLAERLTAIVVDGLVSEGLAKAPRLDMVLAQQTQPTLAADSLAQHVQQPLAYEWLAPVRVCATLDQALGRLDELALGESWITHDGFWCGQTWLRVLATKAEDSVLARQQQLTHYQELSAQLVARIEADQHLLADLAAQQQQAEMHRIQAQKQLSQLLHQRGAQQGKLAKLQAQLTQTQLQAQRIRSELDELHGQQIEDREVLAEGRLELQLALEAWQRDQQYLAEQQQQREQWRHDVLHLRQQQQQAAAESHRLALAVQDRQTREQALRLNLSRAQQQLEGLLRQQHELRVSLQQLVEPLAELQALTEEHRLQLEQANESLQQAEHDLQQHSQRYRQLELQRVQLNAELEPLRQQLESKRLHWQNLAAHREHQQQQLAELAVDVAEIMANLPSELIESVWQQRLEQLSSKISRLGAINLAAIEEYQEQAERKHFLDTQAQDLEEALAKLESAIKHIDKETRTLFMDTFEKVNAGLQHLFPKVFGGGRANLNLTGEDSLSSGVSIMAQPPGKKNSTIHLLSGGEKALTALSLVFAIFQLNPAPFCLLDEVDAPLDDANVGRFCRLVEEMAQKVQFVYITHNKIAMTMAQQLMGVTMHEPGVSRLVTVDVEQAAALAAA